MMKIKGKSGFTLVELMIVVIIVGILAASAVPIYRANMRRALSAEGFATLGAIRSAQRLYMSEFGTFLATTNIEADLGLDTTDNHFWNNHAFRVTIGADGDTFEATATGMASDAPGEARIIGFVLIMNERGQTASAYDGTTPTLP